MLSVKSEVQNVKSVRLKIEIEGSVEEWQQIQNFIRDEANKNIWSPINKMYWLIRNAIDPLFTIIKVDEKDLPTDDGTK